MKRLSRFVPRVQLWGRKRFGREYRVQLRRSLQAHGSDYGGWTIDPTGINAESVVYSFGVGQDISFDLSLIGTFGCHVYAFDPTPRSIEWVNGQELPPQFHFFAYGIAAHDGYASFNPPLNPDHASYTMLSRSETAPAAIQAPVFRLQTIMERLGHKHIDLLKMDVEGAEYAVLDQLGQSRLDIAQLLVEFHHRFAAVGWRQTNVAIKGLNQIGYRSFYISPSGDEFSFMRTNP